MQPNSATEVVSIAARRPKLPWWRKAMPLIGFALLAWVLSRLELHSARQALAQLSPSAVVSCALLFSLNFALKALRWQRMLRAQGFQLPYTVAIAAFFNAQFYGQVTVGHLGELYRAEALIERGVPFGEALSSSIYDRVLDVLLVTLLAGSLGATVLGRPDVVPWALALAALAGFGVWLLAQRMPTLEASGRDPGDLATGLRGRVLRFLLGMRTGLRPLLRSRVLAELSAWTGVAWLGYFAALVALARGLHIDASVTLLVASASLAALSALLPITVSGLGAREIIFIQALALEGVAAERAVVLSLLHLAIMTACVLLLGLVGMAWRKRQRERRAPAAPTRDHG